MRQLKLEPENRPVVLAALKRAEATGQPAAALELLDGTIVTGRTSELHGCFLCVDTERFEDACRPSARGEAHLADGHCTYSDAKTDYMQSRNPRLHTDEMLVALAISAATDENAMRAMQKLDELSGCDLHSSVILGTVDDSVFKRLGINVTCEATYEDNNLYHK